jgi:dTDP-4-dehydrorhamnose reductase
MTIRALVIGRQGQVARALARTLWPVGSTMVFRGRDSLDLAAAGVHELRAAIEAARATIVVNAAAYTAVDKAESETDAAFALNRDGAARLAASCAQAGVPLIHISTDYVFDGAKESAYREDDPVNPINLYGASKEAGERAVRAALPAHAILRSSWVFSPFGTNFLNTMLRLGAEREELRIVADQHGCPTSAYDLARAIVAVAQDFARGRDDAFGTFHVCNAEATTWHGFAAAIFDEAAARGLRRPRLQAIATRDYPTPARRPANSLLDTARFTATFGFAMPPWRAALGRCIDERLQQTAHA